ncbi:hypothetical protein QJS66_13370 [Kocuria rhizophila]|nr:hypothetical protein QJS66_13370 [Kocuria rhizophila]
MVRIQGMKFILDGSVGGRTAAVAEPFEGTDSRGTAPRHPADMAPWPPRRCANGLRQAAIHGIGKRAAEQAGLTSRGRAARLPPRPRTRGGVREGGHAASSPGGALRRPTEEDLQRRRGQSWRHPPRRSSTKRWGTPHLTNLGPERMRRTYPMRRPGLANFTAPATRTSR